MVLQELMTTTLPSILKFQIKLGGGFQWPTNHCSLSGPSHHFLQMRTFIEVTTPATSPKTNKYRYLGIFCNPKVAMTFFLNIDPTFPISVSQSVGKGCGRGAAAKSTGVVWCPSREVFEHPKILVHICCSNWRNCLVVAYIHLYIYTLKQLMTFLLLRSFSMKRRNTGLSWSSAVPIQRGPSQYWLYPSGQGRSYFLPPQYRCCVGSEKPGLSCCSHW